MKPTLEDIKDKLDALQKSSIDEEDEQLIREIERKFDHLLDEATALDGVLRIADRVTINNWARRHSFN
jgi:t-SNARE complex subunit (syntaxin)